MSQFVQEISVQGKRLVDFLLAYDCLLLRIEKRPDGGLNYIFVEDDIFRDAVVAFQKVLDYGFY